MINLTTGPVPIAEEVVHQLSLPPISHRSPIFLKNVTEFQNSISQHLNVKQVFVSQGSGTLANEIMIWQIKELQEKGLILSNGEFGNRLINQASRAGLNFREHKIDWGKHFDTDKIENTIAKENCKWILFAHCETSTGVVNELEFFKKLAVSKKLKCFVDCMSSMGNIPINFSNIAMATASSGKGLCSISGMALIFSNLEVTEQNDVPNYFDLSVYNQNKGVPFTLSSNQFMALKKAVALNMKVEKWESLNEYSQLIFESLSPKNIIPFANNQSRVFTIVQTKQNSLDLGNELAEKGIKLSYESGYLVSRNWLQLALFGNYETKQITTALEVIKSVIK